MALVLLVPAASIRAAAPPAPVTVSPGEGDTIVIPTFTWLKAPGAAYYELEVGPQSNPLDVYWTDQTVHLTVTPDNSAVFPNEALYWRVRGYDSSDTPGAWSITVNFTKHLPAPVLVTPPSGSTLTMPSLSWQAVTGAARYLVELSLSPTFITLDYSYTTYNTMLTPTAGFPNGGPWYWRVTAVDAQGNNGTPSAANYFTKEIPAPGRLGPGNGEAIVEPFFAWNPTLGAAWYQVELSLSPTFVPVEHTYTTYNTQLTPAGAIDHSAAWYWRVSGVDAAGNLGTWCCGVMDFSKTIPAPTLTGPDDGSTAIVPWMSWTAVDGAAWYQVELSLVANFNPIAFTYTTYNTVFTPVDKLPNNTYYWRVSGVDAASHIGTASAARTFIQVDIPAGIDPAPVLVDPGDNETLTNDPSFSWTGVVGAADYRVVVSKNADFSTTYDSAYTDYTAFTPYTYGTSGLQNTYANDVYYWRVQARNSMGTVIATSAARTFTKAMPLELFGPANGVTITTGDPIFTWDRVVGARDYRVKVSRDPSMSPLFDYSYTDYTTFIPYTYGTSGLQNAYPNDTYYWQVDARNHSGVVIATSEARSFTKAMIQAISNPANGATLTADPSFVWSRVVGARDYRVKVSRDPSMSPLYDYTYIDFINFVPYTSGTSGLQDTYSNDTYYWQVDARNHSGVVLFSSATWSFTKAMTLPLIAPANGAHVDGEPTFEWTPVVGARDYRVKVSVNPTMTPLYDYVYTDYPIFTPYNGPGLRDTYAGNTYYWQVEARNHSGTVIVTSVTWSFDNYWMVYLPTVKK
jgi:hypothetical protein